MRAVLLWLLATGISVVSVAVSAKADVSVVVTYLRQEVPLPPVLSNLDPVPEDDGIAGARLGTDDNATTGRFLGQTHVIEVVSIPDGGDFTAAARAALALSPLVVVDAPTAQTLALADLPEAQGAVILNAGNEDPALRDDACRANLLHTAPSLDMRTDALMQFLVLRRWSALALVEGSLPADTALAGALSASATKFGLKIGARKTWAFDADMRRNASAEVPLFTQSLGDHDVLLVADAANDFARYIPFNTWLPRPVAGSDGLRPETWAPVIEQWGAAQLQSRFRDLAGRDMRPRDFAAWAALRAIGEAVTRTGSADPATLRSYMLSDAFELGVFKGRPATFRTWNGQMRQPIALVTDSAQVASAPLEGFLHQRNELDTLGQDQPESRCTAFAN